MSTTLALSQSYAEFRSTSHRAVYIGAGHSDLNKETLIVSTSDPKRGPETYGNRKSKVTRIAGVQVDDPCSGSSVKDLKLGLDASIPVGTSLTELMAAGADLIKILQSRTAMQEIFLTGKVVNITNTNA